MRANTLNLSSTQPQLRVPPDSAPSSGDGGAQKPREKARRRNRIIHSCLECRRRKLKCDRGVFSLYDEPPYTGLSNEAGRIRAIPVKIWVKNVSMSAAQLVIANFART